MHNTESMSNVCACARFLRVNACMRMPLCMYVCVKYQNNELSGLDCEFFLNSKHITVEVISPAFSTTNRILTCKQSYVFLLLKHFPPSLAFVTTNTDRLSIKFIIDTDPKSV